MDYEYVIKNLVENGYEIVISPSLHGDGIDLYIGKDGEMVYHEMLCASIEAGLLEVNSKVELGL